jgi:hypothetical protein
MAKNNFTYPYYSIICKILYPKTFWKAKRRFPITYSKAIKGFAY